MLKAENLLDVFFDSFERMNLITLRKELSLSKKLSIVNEVDTELESSKQPQ